MTTELMNMNDVNGTNDMHNVEEEAANAVAEALTTTADEGGGTGTTPQIAIEELAKSGKLPLHPYCTLFPPASEAAITSLAEDIRKNGLHYRITLKKGEVVDGQWRYNACLKAGEPFEPFEKYFIEYDGDTSDAGLLRFVMSRNVQRRQLSESQKGIIAAKMTRKKNVHDANPQICGFTQKQAAEMMCVSESMVRDGVRLLREGTPELIAKVECGAIKIHKALEQCVAHSENNPESNKIVGTGTDQDDKDVQGSVQDSNTVSSDTSKIEDGGTTPENLSDDPSVGTPEQVNELPTVDTTDIGSEQVQSSIPLFDDIALDGGVQPPLVAENTEPENVAEVQSKGYMETVSHAIDLIMQIPESTPLKDRQVVNDKMRKLRDWLGKEYEKAQKKQAAEAKR